MSRGHVPNAGPATRDPYFPPSDYPEPRSDPEIEADRLNVRRQVEVLSNADHAELDRIITQLQVRQTNAQNSLPFYRYEPAGARTLVACGQLVVRKPGAVGVMDALNSLGYHRAGLPVDGPRLSDVEVVVGPEKTAADLVANVRALRSGGVLVAPNLVVPLGHIVKADDYPSKTALAGSLHGTPRTFPRHPDARVRVAVIDTGLVKRKREDGFLTTVPRLPGNEDPLDVLPAPNGNDRLDWCAGHGTFATGIIELVGPGCDIRVYRFTRGDGIGTEHEAAEMMIRAAEDAAADGNIRLIINASFGTPAADGLPPVALGAAVDRINRDFPNVLIVASAGNTGTTEKMYPAAFDRVVAVGALTRNAEQEAAFSNHGDWVDCSAVGVGVMSTFVQGTLPPEDDTGRPDVHFQQDPWALWSGTSFSAPQISGAVARRCLEDPAISPQRAIEDLLDGQRVIAGYGRVIQLLPGTPT